VHAIVGLGNPGSEYEGTRHNVGFRVADLLSEFLDLEFKSDRGESLVGKGKYRGAVVYIIKPLTFMNNSGAAVAGAVEQHGIALENLLVVCDDFQLPLGTLRMRSGGSDGGHNGLYSIIYHLQTMNIPRLRCGIAGKTMPQKKSEMSRFVLSVFEKEEVPAVKQMIERARDAALEFIAEGITAAMNKFNVARQASM
jgi:PTH1 family peptidyl-tRNA hydrolase